MVGEAEPSARLETEPVALQVVILIGLQASGKSSFYRDHLAETHAQVSKDLYRNTRNKERRQREEIAKALQAGRNVAVDNTNLRRVDRESIVEQVRAWNTRVLGYYFESELEECLQRNARREGRSCVPEPAVRAAFWRLEVPELSEGFDSLWYVRLGAEGFVVEPWRSDPRPGA